MISLKFILFFVQDYYKKKSLFLEIYFCMLYEQKKQKSIKWFIIIIHYVFIYDPISIVSDLVYSTRITIFIINRSI